MKNELLMSLNISASVIEIYAPNVGRAGCAAALRYEVYVTTVAAPHGADVVGRMVGDLRQSRPVEAGNEYVGVHV